MSDEEYYYSSSIDEYSESDGGDDEPIPYWDIVRHGKQFASYRFVIVHPPDGTSDEEEEEHPKDKTTHPVMVMLPRRPPDDLWGCRLRASPPPPPPEEIITAPPVQDNTPAWQSNRLQQSLGITIPPPPPIPDVKEEEEDGEEWSVIRRNKRSSLLRTNIAPLRPPTTRSEDRKDLLCKLSHRNSSCQRAHSLAEWRPKECRRNGCRQTNCQMLHPATEDRTALLMRLITINGTFYHQHAQDFARLYATPPRGEQRHRPSRRGGGGRGRR